MMTEIIHGITINNDVVPRDLTCSLPFLLSTQFNRDKESSLPTLLHIIIDNWNACGNLIHQPASHLCFRGWVRGWLVGCGVWILIKGARGVLKGNMLERERHSKSRPIRLHGAMNIMMICARNYLGRKPIIAELWPFLRTGLDGGPISALMVSQWGSKNTSYFLCRRRDISSN